jgi:hypothetical protein
MTGLTLFWVDGYLQTKGRRNCRSLWSSWSRRDRCGQIAKLQGCRVVGIAGTDEKKNY